MSHTGGGGGAAAMRPAARLAGLAAIVLAVSACANDGTAGLRTESTVESAPAPPWAPLDSAALRFTLPRAIGGVPMIESTPEEARVDAIDFANDPDIRPILIEHGLGDANVHVAQRTAPMPRPTVATHGIPGLAQAIQPRLPELAVAALWVEGLSAAETLSRLEPFFYLVLTTVDPNDYRWDGAKPLARIEEIGGRPYRFASFEQVDVAWYTKGEALFVVLADNPESMAAAMRVMPPSSEQPRPTEADGAVVPPPPSLAD